MRVLIVFIMLCLASCIAVTSGSSLKNPPAFSIVGLSGYSIDIRGTQRRAPTNITIGLDQKGRRARFGDSFYFCGEQGAYLLSISPYGSSCFATYSSGDLSCQDLFDSNPLFGLKDNSIYYEALTAADGKSFRSGGDNNFTYFKPNGNCGDTSISYSVEQQRPYSLPFAYRADEHGKTSVVSSCFALVKHTDAQFGSVSFQIPPKDSIEGAALKMCKYDSIPSFPAPQGSSMVGYAPDTGVVSSIDYKTSKMSKLFVADPMKSSFGDTPEQLYFAGIGPSTAGVVYLTDENTLTFGTIDLQRQTSNFHKAAFPPRSGFTGFAMSASGDMAVAGFVPGNDDSNVWLIAFDATGHQQNLTSLRAINANLPKIQLESVSPASFSDDGSVLYCQAKFNYGVRYLQLDTATWKPLSEPRYNIYYDHLEQPSYAADRVTFKTGGSVYSVDMSSGDRVWSGLMPSFDVNNYQRCFADTAGDLYSCRDEKNGKWHHIGMDSALFDVNVDTSALPASVAFVAGQ